MLCALQNLAMGSSSSYTCAQGIQAWYDEIKDYDANPTNFVSLARRQSMAVRGEGRHRMGSIQRGSFCCAMMNGIDALPLC